MIAQLVAVVLATVTSVFSVATAPYVYHFPRDHASHDTYQTEWWYFTGHLRSARGRRFGYELTFFRFGVVPRASAAGPRQSRWRLAQIYSAHFAITDENARSFAFYETTARDALGQGAASERPPLKISVNGWTLRALSLNAQSAMIMRAQQGNDAITLAQQPLKPPAIHGQGGISRKGPCASCASHYYSYSRLGSTGSLMRSGVRYAVDGTSWMDHEYGSEQLTHSQAGWDWFSIQLHDGRDVMLYRLRERSGGVTPQSSGSLISRAGTVRHLALRAFTVQTTGWWRSPHTHARYPARWIVHVSGVNQSLLLTPTVSDQELVEPQGTTYWEGAVSVADARTMQPLGEGYVELTGYTRPLEL